VEAYVLLKRGKRDLAADWLRDQTEKSPRFADPWIWLAAATDDPAERTDCLETAVLLEPTHPLAREAFSIARGRVSPAGGSDEQNAQPRFRVIKCPQCAGALRYEPGAAEVKCQFCGHRFELEEVDLLEQQTALMGELRLTRRFQGTSWREVGRLARCQSCGAELVMTRHLARQCVFCGSTSVLVEDNRQALIQPDGFLPFKVGEGQATKSVRRALGSKGERNRGGSAEERPKGIYLPFWVFDGFVEARHQPLSLEGVLAPNRQPEPYRRLLMFDNLLYSAMDRPFAKLLESLLPYQLHKLVPYDAHLLADWAAALYRRDVENVVEEARDAMLEAAIRRTRRSSPKVINSWNTKRSFQVTTVTYQLVLLPVWTAVAGPKGQRTVVMVNGQTGEVASGSIAYKTRR
jgi:LSD1 subclass zinc finger protein